MPDQDDIFNRKEKYINKATDALDRLIQKQANDLFGRVWESLIEILNIKDGKIETSAENYKAISRIDAIYDQFVKDNGPNLAKEIFTNVNEINKINIDYFAEFDTDQRDYKATTDAVKKIVNERLGLDVSGNKTVRLKKGGYMDSLLSDNTVRNLIKETTFREVTVGGGFKNFRKTLSDLIVGNEDQLGGFRQYHRNYAYDIYVQIDRLESTLIATDIGLEDFIFAGTVIDTSRLFCKERAAKVFSLKDASKWKELIGKYKIVDGVRPGTKKKIPIGPIVDNPDTYDPITQMGGIACRHLARFVSKEVAATLKKKQESPGS